VKTVFKIFGIILIFLIAIILIGIVVFKIRNNNFLESSDENFVHYLNDQKITWDENLLMTDEKLPFFCPDLYESEVVLLGESHGYAEVQQLDKSLFIHLNRTKGTRFYIAEMDSTNAKMLNTYLGNNYKDENLLKKIISKVKVRIPQQGGKELFEKWSDIYDYNKNLPDSAKIEVIGIDKDVDDKSRISRDSAMMLNFYRIKELRNFNDESFYGLFGLFHVIQGKLNSERIDPFAARLKREGCSVNSFVCFDVDSEVYMPKNPQYPTPENERLPWLSMDGPVVLVKGINDLKEASTKNSITIFNLQESDSPYNNSQKLIDIKSNFIENNFSPYNKSSVTTDFFQYAILLRNVNAITPISD